MGACRARHLSCFDYESELRIYTRRMKCTHAHCGEASCSSCQACGLIDTARSRSADTFMQQHQDGISASAWIHTVPVGHTTVWAYLSAVYHSQGNAAIF
jgi:hypothetical protein